jgi:acetoacetyl-CoA synthetase
MTPLWSPTADRIDSSALREYLNWLEVHEKRPFPDHDALWAWSVKNLDRFWNSIVDYYQVEFSTPWTQVRTADPMPHVRWFSGARLNWAQHALRHGADDATALVCVQEGGGPEREITRVTLRRSVAAAAAWLRRAGVRPGDRIAAYLPNTEHAVIGCLAAAAVGAVWACCSPDFGADGTIGRLAQLEPSVLIAADGYHWNGKVIDRSDVVAQLRDKLPTLQRFVHVPYAFTGRPHPQGSTAWDTVLAHTGLARSEPLVFEQVEFSHPLWVLFSSGTTGLPKGLVHGQGGITLEGTKWAGLYCGLRAGQRMFTYSSTGWALWNMQLGALTQGASIVLYEGSPSHPAGAVWEVAARTRADVMLMGAAVVTASANAGVSPRQEHDLSRLRHLMVSGSALPADGYRWVMENVSADLRIDSTSGGTDISGSFVGSNEYAPVRAGRIGGRLAGVDCAAWDEDGIPVVDFTTLDRDYAARFTTFHQNTERLRILLAHGRDEHADLTSAAVAGASPALLLGSWGANVERAARDFDAIPLDSRDDLEPVGEVLRRYARAGFDDAVVLIGPGGPDPEEVRALLPREN